VKREQVVLKNTWTICYNYIKARNGEAPPIEGCEKKFQTQLRNTEGGIVRNQPQCPYCRSTASARKTARDS
jgi:hypothetical protein